MKKRGLIAALALLGVISIPPLADAAPSASASPSGCSATAFRLDDVTGVYDGQNLELHVYPCGGVAVNSGRNGTLIWGSTYYGSQRFVDGSIMLAYTPSTVLMTPLIYNGIQFPVLVIKPDVPGTIHLWGVTAIGDWFDWPLNKTSDDPNDI